MDILKSKKNKWIIGIVAFLLLILVSGTILFIRSNRPMQQAKKEAYDLAQQYAKLETMENFYWFNREQTYFTVTGVDQSGKDIVVIIPKSGENIQVLNAADGLSEDAVIQQMQAAYPEITVEKAALGKFRDQPAWEITGKDGQGTISYYLFSFENGEEIQNVS
ncbi:cell wall elongation regulator TseB-like domain-containing protein [Enterococcus sp. AZ109]|uniref:cell wall elongation regulator TseB-like domain-containing protein n=1 Tax=Enterococcus sp. AZ109 TaxID=2774634 RepID=UPI003F1FE05C